MLRLDLQKGPAWHDLGHGVRIQTLPVTSAVRMAVSDALRGTFPPPEDSEDAGDDLTGAKRLAYAKAIAREVVTDWEGVVDAKDRKMAPTPEAVEALLDVFELFLAFERVILFPAFALAAEGNGSAPSPNGSSAKGATTARGAGKSRAKPARLAPRK